MSTKCHAHPLTRTTTGLSGHHCDGASCRAKLTESYRCDPCNFDLCGACYGKYKSTQATRLHTHPVTYTTSGLDSHYCDVCSNPTPREAWRCASCNFDICCSCFETVKAPKPEVKEPKKEEVKPTPLVKQHAHPLTKTSGLSGHHCDGCKTSVTESFRCAPCNWDLCGACYAKSSERTSRLHTHPLTYVTSGLSHHFCDGCRKDLSDAKEAWRCASCNFDLCATCSERSSAPKKTETKTETKTEVKSPVEKKVHHHMLTRTTEGLSGHHCDGCRATSLTVSFRCNPCNYDLCTGCYDATNKQVLSLHPHAVTYTTGSSLDTHFCDVCRSTLSGTAWRCEGCNFDICPTCVDRCKAPKPIPKPEKDAPTITKAHTHPLTLTDSGLSGHHCDGCRATPLTTAYRCDKCNFDLCTPCFNRNRMSQTSRMHTHPLTFSRGLVDHWCDDCRKPTVAAWRCAECNFDLCLGCFARAQLPKETKKPEPKKETKTEVKTTEVKGSDDDKFAVKGHVHRVTRTTSSLTGHFCDACRASPLTTAYRCDACNFDLCTSCFESQRITQQSKLHSHPLRWTSGLSAHYCDQCRRSTTEAYRCTLCNYDCCSKCFVDATTSTDKAPSKTSPKPFWSCSQCTYSNPSHATHCHVCNNPSALLF